MTVLTKSRWISAICVQRACSQQICYNLPIAAKKGAIIAQTPSNFKEGGRGGKKGGGGGGGAERARVGTERPGREDDKDRRSLGQNRAVAKQQGGQGTGSRSASLSRSLLPRPTAKCCPGVSSSTVRTRSCAAGSLKRA